MKKKILLSPLIIIILIIVLGVGVAGAAILISGGGNTENVNLQKGLVGHWKLDGNAKDSTPYANNGTVSGAILTTDRKGTANKAYSFDNVDDSFSVSNSGIDGNTWTWSAWIYWRTNNNSGTYGGQLWSAVGGDPTQWIEIYLDKATRGYRITRSNPTSLEQVLSSQTVTLNQWTFLTVTFNNGSLTGYINNQSAGTITVGALTVPVSASFGAGVRGFDGVVDNIRVYNRALSSTEITALYESYDPGIVVSDLQKGLVGNWKMNGNAKDSTPYGNNGTVTGAILTTDRKGQANKAYSFDGTNDYISVASASNLNPTSAFTLEAWVKKSATKAQDIIFNDVHELKLDSNNKAVLRLLTGTRPGTDMDMETAGVVNWDSFNSPATKEKNTTNPIQGTKDLHVIARDTATHDGVYQSLVSENKTYRVKVSYRVVSGSLNIQLGTSAEANTGLGNVGLGLTGSGTVVSYVLTTAGAWGLIMTSTNAGEFYVDDIEVKEVGATLTSSGTASTNFDHIVATYDGSVSKIYINGALDNSLTQAVTLSTDNLATLIGAGATGGTGYEQDFFNGSIDDVRVYNRALSATEVTALYQEYDPGIVVSDLQKGLVGNWKMNGNAKDSTPYGNNGTVSGATLTTDRKGQLSKAYSFNGTSDYISVADSASLDIANAITISMWAKSTVASGSLTKLDRIVEKNNSYTFDFNHSSWGKANFGLNFTVGGFTDLQYTSDLPANTWMFLTATYDGSVMKVYLNGVQDNSVNVSKTIVTNANSAYIGTYGTTPTGTYNFSGLIDDVRIYNRALSPTEITALYQSY